MTFTVFAMICNHGAETFLIQLVYPTDYSFSTRYDDKALHLITLNQS